MLQEDPTPHPAVGPVPRSTIPVTDYRLILRLLLRGKSYRDIESQAGCSHRSIAKAKAVATGRVKLFVCEQGFYR